MSKKARRADDRRKGSYSPDAHTTEESSTQGAGKRISGIYHDRRLGTGKRAS